MRPGNDARFSAPMPKATPDLLAALGSSRDLSGRGTPICAIDVMLGPRFQAQVVFPHVISRKSMACPVESPPRSKSAYVTSRKGYVALRRQVRLCQRRQIINVKLLIKVKAKKIGSGLIGHRFVQ
jgi:hypothetical protein